MNIQIQDQFLIRPEPEVINLDHVKFGGRKYAPIWAKCLSSPGKKVAIRMTQASERQFLTIRKAVWKIKSEDTINRKNWRIKCERGEGKDGDKIFFWIVPSDVLTRI